MKVKATEKQQAIERLKEWVKPGDTIHCILRHTSASGMLRVIDLLVLKSDAASEPGQEIRTWTLSYNAALALGERLDKDRDGIRVSGCGMDMGFHLVYSLGRTLWPDGFECAGEGLCSSCDHSNGDRDYTPHHHKDGGYALKSRWL